MTENKFYDQFVEQLGKELAIKLKTSFSMKYIQNFVRRYFEENQLFENSVFQDAYKQTLSRIKDFEIDKFEECIEHPEVYKVYYDEVIKILNQQGFLSDLEQKIKEDDILFIKYKNYFDKFMLEYIEKLTNEYTVLVKVFPREYIKKVVEKYVQKFINYYEKMCVEKIKVNEYDFKSYEEFAKEMFYEIKKSEIDYKFVNWLIWGEIARNYVENYMSKAEKELWEKVYNLDGYYMDIVYQISTGEIFQLINTLKEQRIKEIQKLQNEIKAIEKLENIYREKELQNQTGPVI